MSVLLWQAYLYAYDRNYDKDTTSSTFIRGRYVGPAVIEEFLTRVGSSLTLTEMSRLAGRLIGSVHFGAKQTELDTELVLGRDMNGKRLPAGIYLYTLRAGSYIKTRKLLLIR